LVAATAPSGYVLVVLPYDNSVGLMYLGVSGLANSTSVAGVQLLANLPTGPSLLTFPSSPFGFTQAVFQSNASVASSLRSGNSIVSATTQTVLPSGQIVVSTLQATITVNGVPSCLPDENFVPDFTLDLVPEQYQLAWKVVGDKLQARATVAGTTWVSFGINDVEQMVGAHIFLAKPTDGVAQQYQINGRSAGLIIPLTAGTPFVSYTQAQGLTTLSFCRPLSAPGIHDINTQGPTTAVFAFGSLGSNTFSRHPDGHRQVVSINFLEGTSKSVARPPSALPTEPSCSWPGACSYPWVSSWRDSPSTSSPR